MRQLPEDQLKALLQERLRALLVSDLHPLNSSDSFSAETLEGLTFAVGQKLNSCGWMTYLVGGTLRDLLLCPNDHGPIQPRDIDIIVAGASRNELEEALRNSLIMERFTRFGGLHLSALLRSGSRVLFDIWTLSDTWGFHAQGIPPRMEDFPGTTFLNIDSCATELLQPAGRERKVFEHGFFDGIAKRVLDVNYEPNPYPYVCAARSLVLAAQLDFKIARPLAKFILQHAAIGGVAALIDAQRSHYAAVRSEVKELEVWLQQIKRQFDFGEAVVSIEVSPTRRRELWFDYPSSNSPTKNAIRS